MHDDCQEAAACQEAGSLEASCQETSRQKAGRIEEAGWSSSRFGSDGGREDKDVRNIKIKLFTLKNKLRIHTIIHICQGTIIFTSHMAF